MNRFLPTEMVSTFNGVVEKIKNDTFLSPAATEKRDLILSNMDSIKDILFHFRYPKFAIVGESKQSRSDILSLFLNPEILRNEMMLGNEWYAFDKIEVTDLRTTEHVSLEAPFPDMILCLITANLKDDAMEKMLADVANLQEKFEDEMDSVVEAVFLIEESESSRQFYKTQKQVHRAWKNLGLERSPLFPSTRRRKISEELIRCVPSQTRLSLVRVLSDPGARTQYIDSIINLATATNSSIASVPLPVADLIPITTVQTLMLVSIAYARGRDLDAKMISAFLGSLGINISVGFAMREIVRALSKFIPLAGPFVSATIAASTTATLGKKASSYFNQD